MKVGDLSRKFGISTQTINRWTNRFDEFFEDKGSRVKNYSVDEIVVVATINELSGKGMTYDAIEKELTEGYRTDVDGIETMGYEDGRMVPAAAVEQIVDASELRVALTKVEAERDHLESRLSELQEKYDAREEEIRDLNREIKELNREIIDLLKENRDK